MISRDKGSTSAEPERKQRTCLKNNEPGIIVMTKEKCENII